MFSVGSGVSTFSGVSTVGFGVFFGDVFVRVLFSSCIVCRVSDSFVCSFFEFFSFFSSSEDYRCVDLGRGLDGVGFCISSSEFSDVGSFVRDRVYRFEVL